MTATTTSPAPGMLPSEGGAAAAPKLAHGYRPRPDTTDAMVGPAGRVTADWTELARRLDAARPDTLEHRRDQAQQVLDDNGILLAAAQGLQQPHLWPLDPVPFQLGEQTFARLADALCQRATLLNTLAADLLTRQHVLRDKALPPALLYANPHYHRAYHDLPVAHGRYVHLYGADIVRGDDGAWWVLGDRTQAPSGLGFTLENRIAISRVHADWLGTMRVQRHARFFLTLRETLTHLALRNRHNPHIVLLSEGLTGHRGFEDAFLARYLGYTLTVGEDLATRRGQTVLKTLGGALPVEVVFRRVNDDVCDPVELRSDSALGVAGLVESQRQEQVSIANMLGAQLVEVPALMAFLQPLCRFYFGEDLKLASAATWWCGQEAEREHVLDHLDDLYLFPAFSAGAIPIDAGELTAAERAALVARIKATPDQWVGQERMRRGTTPVWERGRLEPWCWGMRGFAVMREDDYAMLPGGLIRVARDGATLDYAPSPGERTQDCWVQSSAPVDPVSLLSPTDGPVELKRLGAELPSRVADNLYWLGRSIEAAEGRARLLRTLLARVDPDAGRVTDEHAAGWVRLLSLLGPVPKGAPAGPLPRLRRAVLGTPGAGNLRGAVRECVRLAQAVRDRLSLDAWRLLSRTERHLTRTADEHDASPPEAGIGEAAADTSGGDLPDLAALLNHVVLELVAFGGLASESMTRTLGWRFMELGRRIERATHTATLLRAAMVEPAADERGLLEATLEVCDSTMTYRARYLAHLRPVPAVDLLLTDEINPRSVAWQLARIDEHLSTLPRDHSPTLRDEDQRVALALLNGVRLADPYHLADGPARTRRTNLDGLLKRVLDELPAIDAALTARYLVHADLPRQFAGLRSDAGDDDR